MSSRKATKAVQHACNRCRAAKLRCFVDTVADHEKCRRCYEGNKECIFAEMAPRSRRERSDTRLRLLEQEMKTLKARFESALQNPTSETREHVVPASENRPIRETHTESSNTVNPVVNPDYLQFQLSPGHVEQLFDAFIARSLPQFPVLNLDTVPVMRKMEGFPSLLTFAIVTAATRATDPTMFRQLHQHLSKVLAEKIVAGGEKSIELLQALLVVEVWYDPPDDLGRLNFYLWLQIAADMAQRLGLWWNTNMIDAVTNNTACQGQLQQWRLAIATYLCLSTVSVSLHRPSSISFPTNARTALSRYTMNATHGNDKRLAAWVTLQLIAEEIEALRAKIKHQENSTCDFVSSLLESDNRLLLYKRMTALNDTLRVQYFYVCCKLKEVSISYHMARLSKHNVLADDPIRKSHEKSIIELIQACHDIVQTVLQMHIDQYLCSPTVTTVRALYALRTLFLLHRQNSDSCITDARVSLRVLVDFEACCDQLRAFFLTATGSIEHRIPAMALAAMQDFHNYGTQRNSENAPTASSSVEGNDLDMATSPAFHASSGDVVSGKGSQTYTAVASTSAHSGGYGGVAEPYLNTDGMAIDYSNLPDGLPVFDPKLWELFGDQSQFATEPIFDGGYLPFI